MGMWNLKFIINGRPLFQGGHDRQQCKLNRFFFLAYCSLLAMCITFLFLIWLNSVVVKTSFTMSHEGEVTPELAAHVIESSDSQAVSLNAMNSAISASMDVALRGEIKRLREEVTDLRREASRVEALQSEVNMLRAVTLMQAEEKVPIRLRELEAENQRLKRTNRSLEEKLSSIEGDMKYRELLSSWSAADQQQAGFLRGLSVQPAQSELERSINDANFESGILPSTSLGTPQGGKVLVIKPATNPCLSCGTRLAAAERAFDTEKRRLTSSIKILESRLDAANEEIRAVQAWVAPLVHSLQQYPRLSDNQPLHQLHNFTSPTRMTSEAQHFGRQLLGSSMDLQSPPSVSRPQTGVSLSNSSYLDLNPRRSH